jgi:hypothetical protein
MGQLDNTLQSLRAFPAALRAFVADTPAAALDWRPASWEGIPSEMLTVRQQVCHVRDIEIDGYALRFARLLRETDPILESIDGYELIESRQYDQTELDAAFGAFERARANTLHLLERVSAHDLDRRGTFEGYGTVTVKGLIHFLCSHDQQHLAGIQWLIGMHAATTG